VRLSAVRKAALAVIETSPWRRIKGRGHGSIAADAWGTRVPRTKPNPGTLQLLKHRNGAF
jgi:hypothetical protein